MAQLQVVNKVVNQIAAIMPCTRSDISTGVSTSRVECFGCEVDSDPVRTLERMLVVSR